MGMALKTVLNLQLRTKSFACRTNPSVSCVWQGWVRKLIPP